MGSNLAVWFKSHYPGINIIAADNLRRHGSELNLPRLRKHGIVFIHADIRNSEDMLLTGYDIDLIVECSAEPSVLAGYDETPDYVINTNLLGTVRCLELARRRRADVIFLSTSRVYPVSIVNSIATLTTASRFTIAPDQTLPGVSEQGISEKLPLEGSRSLYGATKLCSELLLEEYGEMYGLRFVINRCGVLAGPWQMGKVDQGVFALWVASHYFQRELSYIGWGGTGKQVRDLLHVDDLARLLDCQLRAFDDFAGMTFNVGGGKHNSLSLMETTELCRELTGHRITIRSVPENRRADVKLYITDNSRVTQATGWAPSHSPTETLGSIFEWIKDSELVVRHLWSG